MRQVTATQCWVSCCSEFCSSEYWHWIGCDNFQMGEKCHVSHGFVACDWPKRQPISACRLYFRNFFSCILCFIKVNGQILISDAIYLHLIVSVGNYSMIPCNRYKTNSYYIHMPTYNYSFQLIRLFSEPTINKKK